MQVHEVVCAEALHAIRECQRKGWITKQEADEWIAKLDLLTDYEPPDGGSRQLKMNLTANVPSISNIGQASMSMAIIYRAAGAELPEEYVTKLAAKYKSFRGVAIADDGVIDKLANEKPIDFKYTSLVDTKKPKGALYVVGNLPNGANEHNVQPFTIVKQKGADGQDIPLLVGALIGDFSNHAKTGGSYTNEFYTTTGYLIPKFTKLFNLVKEDQDTLFKELEDELLKKELSSTGLPGSAVVMLSADEKLHTFGPIQMDEMPWGWTTDKECSLEAPVTKPEEKPPTKDNAKTKTLAELMAEMDDEPETKTDDPPKKEEPKTVDVKKEEEVKHGRPPNNVKDKPDVYAWYEDWAFEDNPVKPGKGLVPEAFIRRPKVPIREIPRSQEADKFRSLEEAATKLKATVAKVEPAKKPPTPAKREESQPDPLMMQPSLPIVPEEALKLLEKEIASEGAIGKMLDINSKVLKFDPAKAQEMEKRTPTLAMQLGKNDMTYFDNWPLEAFEALVKYGDGKALATLAFNLRNSWLIARQKAEKPAAQKTLAELMAEEDKAA